MRIQGAVLEVSGVCRPDPSVLFFAGLWRERRLPVEKLISDRLNVAMDALADGRALRRLIVFDDIPTKGKTT
jgi:alcohol dehydrogenase